MNLLKPLLDNYVNFIISFKGPILFYSSWIFFHYICSQLYYHFCAPPTWYGFLVSPFLALTPHCYAFRWIINEGGGQINTMFIVFGSWAASKLLWYK
jgi:hypothetical protein